MIGAQPMLTYTVLYTYILGSNPVESKNNFASVMLTEIISWISKDNYDLELLERSL